ncbi:MAG: ABC transporter substrate-binding protein, partial [Vicinamibacteria bacterium]
MSRRFVAVLGAVVIGTGLAACGSDSGSSGGSSDTIIRGTTDQPISLDPSGAYDLPSYDIIYNVYQNLVQFPPGETKPVPEAAESCDFTDDVTFECKMRSDGVFSDGSTLDAEDVVFSFERNVKIADPNGASSLLANMKSVEAPDKDTVVFHLAEPDATWPSVLATASFAIVPSDSFPADKLQDDSSVIGSGRYTVEQYEPGQQTVMQANDQYTGEDPAQTNTAILQYFDKASALKLALESGGGGG